jgi:hypothetical protein
MFGRLFFVAVVYIFFRRVVEALKPERTIFLTCYLY